MIKKYCMFSLSIVSLFLLSSCLSQGVKKVSDSFSDEENLVILKIQESDYGTVYIGGLTSSSPKGFGMDVVSLYWFGSWAEGWTEIRFNASGHLDAVPEGKEADIFIVSPIELISIEDVKIRYRDTIIEHDAAMRQFLGRNDRIKASVEIIKENASVLWKSESAGKSPFYVVTGVHKNESFVNKVQQFLFPEFYSYLEGYSPSTETEFQRDGEIKWDTGYTKKVFPEHFQEVRNSGTIYRDWIETKRYFYFLYMFDEDFGKNAAGKVFSAQIK